jgi:hypothetical protein
MSNNEIVALLFLLALLLAANLMVGKDIENSNEDTEDQEDETNPYILTGDELKRTEEKARIGK